MWTYRCGLVGVDLQVWTRYVDVVNFYFQVMKLPIRLSQPERYKTPQYSKYQDNRLPERLSHHQSPCLGWFKSSWLG